MGDYQTSDTIYGFSIINYGDLRMLWLEKYLGERGGYGDDRWEVLAVLVIPTLPESETYARDTCAINDGQPDPEIFAIAKIKDSMHLDDIRQAWRANRGTSAFEPISADGIVCFISPLEYWR